eukprot:TRINITY_DN14998_c0_g1_i1.p1 TRINITY_DN14998_c0_g1~~TRINITY_DN14998_c0_g1_i1.p1  ORF type:complete len:447 (+),score=43.00 TRINITY_DN14998_c0_g1_i1:137-1477(+)
MRRSHGLGPSPLMEAVMNGSVAEVREVFRGTRSGARSCLNKSDVVVGITPLMATCMRVSGTGDPAGEDEALRVAKFLVEKGARLDVPDDGPGCTPTFMAAQEGAAKILKFLLDGGAELFVSSAHFGRGPSTTTPTWIAAQNNHPECVAHLVNAVMARGMDNAQNIIDAPNLDGKTPCHIAVDKGNTAVVGVLARAGADLRRAHPMWYSTPHPNGRGEETINNHPMPGKGHPHHEALASVITSFARRACNNLPCATPKSDKLSLCGRCCLAYYCCRQCQLDDFSQHKLVCKELKRGSDLVTEGRKGDWLKEAKKPGQPWLGFEEGYDSEDDTVQNRRTYVRATHPVWEYDAGTRGHPVWTRYPPRIEESLEDMANGEFSGGPWFIYRPGFPDNDGLRTTSIQAPASAVCHTLLFVWKYERDRHLRRQQSAHAAQRSACQTRTTRTLF